MLQLASCDHRAIDLAKAKRVQKWQRDPEGMRIRILEAAKQEFSTHGLAGARVDRIAANAGAAMGGELLLGGLENTKPHPLGVALPFLNAFCFCQINRPMIASGKL